MLLFYECESGRSVLLSRVNWEDAVKASHLDFMEDSMHILSTLLV